MKTMDFKTKTVFKQRQNLSNPNYWGVAIDITNFKTNNKDDDSSDLFDAFSGIEKLMMGM